MNVFQKWRTLKAFKIVCLFTENGGTVPPPAPPEVAAVGAAGRPHHDQSALIDPIQKTALDRLTKTRQETVTASLLKGKLMISSLHRSIKLNPVGWVVLSLSVHACL